jgi:drug/metabolite transporter (DMT)-like permease
MTKLLIILAIAFIFEAFGVIALKKGLDEIGPAFTERQATMPLWKNILKLVGEWFTNKNILFGVLLEAIFFGLLQYLLGQRDVSFIWPLTALTFVTATLAAKYILHEKVDAIRWTGVLLIVSGAILIGISEQRKPKAKTADGLPTGEINLR